MMPRETFDIISELARFMPPAIIVDKSTYFAFLSYHLRQWTAEHDVTGFVETGTETDVCILARVLAGVELGLRMTIVTGAMSSPSDASHDALLSLYATRFSEQIDTVNTKRFSTHGTLSIRMLAENDDFESKEATKRGFSDHAIAARLNSRPTSKRGASSCVTVKTA